MITFFLASNIAGPVGGTISSVLVLIIVAFVCCITVVALGKKGKLQNVRSCNTQQVELQTIRSPEMTQRTNQADPPRQPPNNTIDIDQPPLPYNENSNTTGPHEAPAVVPCPYLAPYPQQPPVPYQQQAGHHLVQQPPSLNSSQPSVPPYPYQTQAFNTFETNQDRQPNTSATLTSFATLCTQNPIVQASRQQGSNEGIWEAPSDVQATLDNPACECLDAAHGEPDYEDMEEHYEEIKY